MNKISWIAVLTLSLLSLALTPLIHAQYVQHTLRADIPFDFMVGDKAFAAGKYSLLEEPQHVVRLRDAQGRVLHIFTVHSVEAAGLPEAGRLVFRDSEDGLRLVQVWRTDSREGSELAYRRSSSAQLARGSQPREITVPVDAGETGVARGK